MNTRYALGLVGACLVLTLSGCTASGYRSDEGEYYWDGHAWVYVPQYYYYPPPPVYVARDPWCWDRPFFNTRFVFFGGGRHFSHWHGHGRWHR